MYPAPTPRYRSPLLALLAALAAAPAGCGVIGTGGGTGRNDAAPSGVIVAQGAFTSQAQPVTGTVSVYKTTCGASTCAFVVRLQGLSAAGDGTKVLVVTTGTGTLGSRPALTSASGNQNYTFSGLPAMTTWSQVSIQPSTATPDTVFYGVAILTAVGGTPGT